VQRYWVESEDLWSADERGVVWRGRPDGKPSVHVVDASLVATTRSARWQTIEAATGRILTSVVT
jgi:hypothetical protein